MSNTIWIIAQAATTEATSPLSLTRELEAAKARVSPEQLRVIFDAYGLPAVKAMVLLIIGWLVAGWLAGLVRRVCERGKFDVTLGRFLSNVVRWLMLAAVVIMCLSAFGVQVTSLVALLGTVGVAIGLALQGSLGHIASGVMLLIFRPFKVGDMVTAGGQTGIVEEVGLFSTLLDTPDNQRIIVPNGAIVGGVIINSTFFDNRLVEVTVPADAKGELEAQRATLMGAAARVQGPGGRVADRAPSAFLHDIGPASVWMVGVWCKTPDVRVVRERLIAACHQALREANMAPPPPVTMIRSVSGA